MARYCAPMTQWVDKTMLCINTTCQMCICDICAILRHVITWN